MKTSMINLFIPLAALMVACSGSRPASEVSSTAPEPETPSVQYGGASKTDSLFLSLERTPVLRCVQGLSDRVVPERLRYV